MKIRTIKALVMLVTILLIISLGMGTVQAASLPINPSDVVASKPSSSDLTDFGGRILGIIQTIGVVLAVVILAILGIKYMMGSAEEKADYKKSFIPYIVGAAVVALAPQIAGFIFQLLG